MSISIARGTSDETLDKIIVALRTYERDHPLAQIDVYRQSPVSVRLRIIDPDFAKQPKSQRHQRAWHYLDELSDDVQGDISTLVLIAPQEATTSFANMDFEDPVPSEM